MNKGIQMARGRYINFMNADDKFHDSEVLETLLQIKNWTMMLYMEIQLEFLEMKNG